MNLSHEDRFLLSCIRSGRDAAFAIKDISKNSLDWDEIIDSASWHTVAPLVYGTLKDMPERRFVPPKAIDVLKEAYYAAWGRNMLLYAELGRVLEAFRAEGIEVILLKGAALAKTLYPDIGMRPMNDVDIMVKREDLFQAERRLSELGYVFHGGNTLEWWRENYCHIGYVYPEQSVLVELHWHITSKTDSSGIHGLVSDVTEGFWRRAHHGEHFGDNVRILSPEDALLHLSLHFLKHRFPYNNQRIFTSRGALMQISDIFLILKRHGDDIGPKIFGQETGVQGAFSLVEFVVCLVQKIMEDRISSKLMTNCRAAHGDHEALNLMAKKIFIREETRTGASHDLVHSLSKENVYCAIRKIFRAFFPSREVIAKKYGVPLSSKRIYLYYCRRPVDLLLRHKSSISEIPLMKDEVMLNRWFHSLDDQSKARNDSY
ncbi:MAG TPA: nucleotidyltransferase family protein [Thermodesulfovibrionales bacterium]|jgi:hypothetical protein|nr:nucleotidyltransferase family protein [Thermodesulfovibrionales bacterium]